MFLFLCCLGRRLKRCNRNSNSSHATETPASSFGESTEAICEVEPQKLEERAPSSLSMGMKSCRSSVVSRSSFSQFCQSFSSSDPARTYTPKDSRMFGDFGWASPHNTSIKSKPSGLDLQIKCANMDSNRSVTIPEESEEPTTTRPRSYSDDPFAPPTPRMATHTFSYCGASHPDSSTMSSVATVRGPHVDINETSSDPLALAPLTQAQLPTITRVSKLSFGDWTINMSPESLVAPRSRLPSVTRSSTLGSPSTCRTPNSYTICNFPLEQNPSCFFSRTGDTNQVPFPVYP